ncbi:MAG: RHS repeat-associated core domain-containing protein, partial [Pyrinomonadaceae bacterium]
RVGSVTDVFGQVVSYAYDASSNRTQLGLNAATSATYQYDVINRLTTLTDGASLATTFSYDNTDKLTTRTLPNGVVTTSQYDDLNRLTRLTHAKAGNTLADFQYQLNAVNNITQTIDSAGTHNYTYDTRDRLTAATHANQTNESYTFDDLGNRTSSQQGSSYSYQPFNRLVAANGTSFGYDTNGNQSSKSDTSGTWTYSWDYENRLKQASKSGVTVSFSYDALGQRIQRTSSASGITRFVYDGPDVMRDLDGTSATIADFLNGPGIDNKLRQTTSGTTSDFLADHLGTTRALADASGALTSSISYDSYGNVSSGSASTRYTYTGREVDPETGLMYYRARFYDPEQGRFISEDPVGLSGGINQFSYVSNNPQNAKDPTGLYEIDVHYYLTYFLAKKTGCFNDNQARLIADATQTTDENADTRPGLGSTASQRERNRKHHALHRGAAEGVGSSQLWQDAMRGNTNYVGLGRYLHYLQDTFSHAGFQSDVIGHLATLHYYDKTDTDKPRALRMAGATWNALNEYAKAKKCGCQGRWDPSWWKQVIDFTAYEGANFAALETIDSNGEILNFGMTNNPQYLLRKVRTLGLNLR